MNEEFLKYKIKHTVPREYIYNFIKENNAVSIKEIIDNNQNIDQSTVYRIIKLFCNKKLVTKYVNNNIIFYTINDNHEHLLECDYCHKKEIINICPFSELNIHGFKIKESKVIHGICHECQKRVGIFVGSFNPPTKAHLEIGQLLYQEKILDKIIFVPCNSFLKKEKLIDIKKRINMLNNYCKNYDYLEVSEIEIENGKENFSYSRLDLLQKNYNLPLYVILGADNFLNLYKWDNYKYLLNNYYFIVIRRLNIKIEDVINKYYSKYKDHFIIIDYNNNISSSYIRDLINNNQDVSNYLNKEILNYINKNNLYKN